MSNIETMSNKALGGRQQIPERNGRDGRHKANEHTKLVRDKVALALRELEILGGGCTGAQQCRAHWCKTMNQVALILCPQLYDKTRCC